MFDIMTGQLPFCISYYLISYLSNYGMNRCIVHLKVNFVKVRH